MSAVTNAIGSLFGAVAPQPATPAPIAAPEVPKSQVASLPDQGNMMGSMAGTPGGGTGGTPGVASTFLSGGVDPTDLSLNKGTLLGGSKTLG